MKESNDDSFDGFMYDQEVVRYYGRMAIEDTLDHLPKLLKSDQEAKKALEGVYTRRLEASIGRIESLTESPIEKQVAYSTFLTLFIHHPSLCMVPDVGDEDALNVKYWVMPNHWVTKKVRTDLFITRSPNKSKGKTKGLVVECDSFQWHGDKEAFAKDKVREREITKLGYPVIRFSGREINKNPFKVSCEIINFMDRVFHPSRKLSEV